MSDFDPLTFDPENIDPEELAELAGEEKDSDNLESARASLDDIAPEHRVPEGFRSGFVAIVGRPNVGKSTLVNALVGRKVVITSDRPETTRRDIRAIMTRPDSQLVLVDTPGIHRPRTLLGRRLDDMVDDRPWRRENSAQTARPVRPYQRRADFATLLAQTSDLRGHQNRPAEQEEARRQAHRSRPVRPFLRNRRRFRTRRR